MLDCVLNLLVQPLITVAGSDRSAPTGGVDDGGVSEAVWKSARVKSTRRSEAWMKDMTAKGEALNDSMLSQQLVWWCLDLAIWHHVPSSARINVPPYPPTPSNRRRHQPR